MSSDLTASLAFGLCRPDDAASPAAAAPLAAAAAAVHLARLVKFSFLSHLLWPMATEGLGLNVHVCRGGGVTGDRWPLFVHYYRVKCDKSVCAGGGCLFSLYNWLDKPAGAARHAAGAATPA